MKIQEIQEMKPFYFFKWMFSNDGLSKDEDVKSMIYDYMNYINHHDYIMIDKTTLTVEYKHAQSFVNDDDQVYITTESYLDYLMKRCNKERLLFFDRISKITGYSVEGKTNYYKQIYKQMIECRTILDGHIDVLGYDFLDSFLDDLIIDFKSTYLDSFNVSEVSMSDGFLFTEELKFNAQKVRLLYELGVLKFLQDRYKLNNYKLSRLVKTLLGKDVNIDSISPMVNSIMNDISTSKSYPMYNSKVKSIIDELKKDAELD